jgi:hypothetical protein
MQAIPFPRRNILKISGQPDNDIYGQDQKNEEIADHRDRFVSVPVALGKMAEARDAIKYPGGNGDRHHEAGHCERDNSDNAGRKIRHA